MDRQTEPRPSPLLSVIITAGMGLIHLFLHSLVHLPDMLASTYVALVLNPTVWHLQPRRGGKTK